MVHTWEWTLIFMAPYQMASVGEGYITQTTKRKITSDV